MMRRILTGAAAGAAGTTALNAVTYLDMVLRARPTSSTPEDTVERVSDRLGVDIPGDDDERQNRVQGLGPLTGILTGVTVGAVYGALDEVLGRPSVATAGLLTGAMTMVGTIAPMAALGISDPREWALADWVSDAVPHAAYGLVAAFVYRAADH